jgi:hypothetical protein
MLTSITARRTSQEAKNKLNDFTEIDEALMKALYSTECLPEKRGEEKSREGKSSGRETWGVGWRGQKFLSSIIPMLRGRLKG